MPLLSQRLRYCIMLSIYPLLLFSNQPGTLLPTSVRLRSISINNGLPGETVRAVYQDKEGYIWLGIESLGICRFNGNQYETYGHVINDSSSLSSDFVETICEDKKGNLWIGTDFGLNKLSIDLLSMSMGKRFTQYFHNDTQPGSLSDNAINALFKDSFGVLWIGTNGGLDMLNDDCNTFQSFSFKSIQKGNKKIQVNAIFEDKIRNLWIGTNAGLVIISPDRRKIISWNKNNSKLHNVQVNTICEDKNGILWIGTQSGISLFNPKDNSFRKIQFTGRAGYMNVAGINKIKKTTDNSIWIGSFSNGLIIYNTDNNTYQYLSSKEQSTDGIKSDHIRDFCQDINGIIWIAVKNKGLYTFDKRIETFEYITESVEPGVGLSDNQVLSIFEAKDKTIWIGTRFGGLNKYDPGRKKFEYYNYKPNAANSIGSSRIESILEDSDGLLWLATVDGLFKFDRNQNRFYHYDFEPIKVIKEDSKGQLWLGTKKGIYRFDKKTKQYFPINPINTKEHLDIIITTLIIDSYDIIWAGTDNSGLIEYLPETNSVNRYKHSNTSGSISNNMIRSIYEDQQHRLWIGTKLSGINLFNRETKKFTVFTTNNGLPSNSVFSITSDNKGFIWLATNKGIAKFQPEKNECLNFTSEYGLQGDIFISGAVCKTHDGKLFFGGDNGLNSFYPESIYKTEYKTPVFITSVKCNEGFVNPDNLINNELKFRHNDHISIEFTMLNYNFYKNSNYTYKLEGLNNEWTHSMSRNFVSYINLPPGKYRFIVKGMNSDGSWSGVPAMYNFEVSPPWWFTWQAMMVYFFIIILIFMLIYKFLSFKAFKENEVKELKLESQQAVNLSNFKIRFFTNITHEIRTPLTLMLPSIEKLNTLKDIPQEANEQLTILKKSSNRLLNLVDELLEFRKIEQGKLNLKLIKSDIIGFITDIASIFKETNYQKHIDFCINTELPKLEILFDPHAIEKILTNLITNAIKFTNSGGKIKLSLIIEEKYLLIKLEDTGIGIPAHEIEHIFEPFYQSQINNNKTFRGTGIGLALVKNLTELHHGKLRVKSYTSDSKPENDEFSSCFEVLLPLNIDSMHHNDIVDEKLTDYSNFLSDSIQQHAKITEDDDRVNLEGETNDADKKPLVLLVEDNDEIRQFIKKCLIDKYHVKDAPDGNLGFEKAVELMPDIVISDIMMPVMNGIEFCRAIKSDQRTSHIPVILLTAHTAEEHILEGYSSGADDYISKPFNIVLLIARISNLINIRLALKQQFSRDLIVKSNNQIDNSVDSEFLKKVIANIEKNMGDSLYGVEVLSKEIGMSSRHLLNKLQTLTEYTPVELIRILRLKKSIELLKEHKLTISEIAYNVGFTSPGYFSTCFLKQYNVSPKEFLASLK